LHERGRERAPEDEREDRHHAEAADELGGRELPPDQDREQDPELDDEVRRGELEGHRGREVGTATEERPGEGDRSVRARGRGGAQAAGHARDRGESSGKSRVISRFETTA
jgi:hypothetical protein